MSLAVLMATSTLFEFPEGIWSDVLEVFPVWAYNSLFLSKRKTLAKKKLSYEKKGLHPKRTICVFGL